MIRKLFTPISALAEAIRANTEQRRAEFEWQRSHANFATKHDLKELEEKFNMKNSEVKALIATASKRSVEAFAEISKRIADQQQQINDLINGAGDPDVTDEQFLTDLNTLKTTTDQLADIVPDPTAKVLTQPQIDALAAANVPLTQTQIDANTSGTGPTLTTDQVAALVAAGLPV